MSDEEVAVEVQNRIMIKVGDVGIDLTGSAKDISIATVTNDSQR